MTEDAGAIEPLIIRVRRQRVVLDADLAQLYGVPTRRFNEAFKPNRQRFPEEFAFQLTAAEFGHLRSQSVASRSQPTDSQGHNENRSQIATGSQKHGAVMAANLLRSERAIQISVFVIRAFMRLREQSSTNAAILKRRIGFHSE